MAGVQSLCSDGSWFGPGVIGQAAMAQGIEDWLGVSEFELDGL